MVTVHQLRQEILALQGGSAGLQMLVCVHLVFLNFGVVALFLRHFPKHRHHNITIIMSVHLACIKKIAQQIVANLCWMRVNRQSGLTVCEDETWKFRTEPRQLDKTYKCRD